MKMAEILPGSLAPDFEFDWSDIDGSFQRERDWIDNLEYETIDFPYADGAAIYAVIQHRPHVILQHVRIGDAWRLPEYQLRGLTPDDVDDMLERKRGLRELFS